MSHLAHGRQHPGLAVRVAVGADAEVHLLGVRRLLERLRDAENGVGRAHRHVGEARRRARPEYQDDFGQKSSLSRTKAANPSGFAT